jgi:hypothetical protein
MEQKNKDNKEEIGKLSVTINLVQIKVLDKKGKPVKNQNGEDSFLREDSSGLMSLLNRFDSRLHEMKDMKSLLNIKDALVEAWSKEKLSVDLSLDQAAFLKRYLAEFQKADGKNEPIKEFEMRTLLGVLEQLE